MADEQRKRTRGTASVEIYATSPDGETAVAQLQVEPQLVEAADQGRAATAVYAVLEPLVRWATGDERYELTLEGLAQKREQDG